MTDDELLAAARRQRVVPLFHDGDAGRAADVVAALADGGARLIEFTLRGPGAEHVLAALTAGAPSGVVIGAGTVRDAAAATAAIDAGAAFVVAPNAAEAVAETCRRAGIAYVPGCLTPTEIVTATAWGTTMVKVFPIAAVGGHGYVRALRGPFPDLQVMATGGVTLADVPRYLAAGCACVGIGAELVRPVWVRDGDGGAVARAMRSAIEAASALDA